MLWEDGTLEGDASLKANQQALAIGRTHQLRRVLSLLRESKSASVAEIRAALQKLPVKLSAGEVKPLVASGGGEIDLSYVEAGQSYVRTAVLDDLQAYMQSQSANANVPAPVWVQDALSRYSAWLGRLTR